jgi:hypothetical protein
MCYSLIQVFTITFLMNSNYLFDYFEFIEGLSLMMYCYLLSKMTILELIIKKQ